MFCRVIYSPSPGYWRVTVGAGVGMMDGGAEQTWPAERVPPEARRPGGEFRIVDWPLGGEPVTEPLSDGTA